MAESTLTITIADLKRAFGRHLGLSDVSTDWSPVENRDFTEALEAAQRQVYFPIRANGQTHRWSFLYPDANLTTNAPYSTGTIGITAGTVTLTGGTWPSWAAQGRLKVSGDVYVVATRGSDTQLVLEDTGVTVAAGTAYQLGQAYYDLPDDFIAFDSPLTYRPGVSTYYPAIELHDEQQLRVYQQAHEYFHRPLWAAIVPKTLDATAGQRWRLFLAPTPDQEYRFFYRYMRAPDALTDANTYHWGGVPFSEMLRLSLLAKAEEMLNDGSTHMQQRFQVALESAINFDRQQNAPENLGYNGDGPMYENRLPGKYARHELAYYDDINYIPL